MKKILIVFLFAAAAFGQTKSIVPRATHQGYLGTTSKSWLGANIDTIHAAVLFGAADYNTLTNKPSTFTPSAHTQDWSTITNQPSIPAANDSSSASANSWKFYGLDSTTYKAHVLAGKAASATVSDSSSGGAARAVTTIQYQGLDSATYKAHVLLGNAASATSSTQFSTLDSTTYKAHVLLGTAANATQHQTLDTTTLKAHTLLGKAASATIADSTNGGAAKLNGKAAALYQDSTQLVRTARIMKVLFDTSKVVAATRTPIYLSGVLATDRAWVVFSDSTSGVR